MAREIQVGSIITARFISFALRRAVNGCGIKAAEYQLQIRSKLRGLNWKLARLLGDNFTRRENGVAPFSLDHYLESLLKRAA